MRLHVGSHVANDGVYKGIFIGQRMFLHELQPLVLPPYIDQSLYATCQGLSQYRVNAGTKKRIKAPLDLHEHQEGLVYKREEIHPLVSSYGVTPTRHLRAGAKDAA